MSKEKTKKKSLTVSMMAMLIMGWLLPLMVIAFFMLYLVSSMLNRQIEKTIVSSTDNAVEICRMKLEEIWTASKNASYDSSIRDSYYEFKKTNDRQQLYAGVTYYLNQQYKYDSSMLCTMVFLTDSPEEIYYTYNTYQNNNTGNEGYARVSYFKEHVMEQALEQSEELDTGVGLIFENQHLYMVRNLVDASFRPYAMIVIELSMPDVFSGLEGVWGAQSYQVYLDGTPLMERDFPKSHVLPEVYKTRSTYVVEDIYNYSYRSAEFGENQLIYAVRINREIALDEIIMLRYVSVVVLAFLVPLIIMIFYFFERKVSRPMRELISVAKKIAEGDYGHQVRYQATSKEFDYLQQTFNVMSKELKYQFETIYEEELALRDANIMALQSQINPHFLNNTLEIINWEARLSGADNVSGMIEALGTMLSATMNRRQRKFVTLSEELSYVDAYLYIISRRFGDRFKVYRDIDESLLQMEVPMLIIQPIVENAVEHGVEENKDGIVGLRIYSDWDRIIIEVRNDGGLSEKDRARIDSLLNGEDTDENAHHVSLGIRNVNRRLKIIYGGECGLTITSDENQYTVSRIVVKMLHKSGDDINKTAINGGNIV